MASPAPKPAFNTTLTPDEEKRFQAWKAQYAAQDSGEDYDLRGAFKAGVKPDASGHMPDTFKKPNHPTFSNESRYAVGTDAAQAGHWQGDKFIPATAGAPAPPPTAFKVDETSPIIDRASGQRVRVNEQDINALVLDGKVGYSKDHQVNVVAPNGQSFKVTGDYLRYALSNGYKIETAKQQAAREFVQQHKGLSGTAMVALGQFIDEALFDVPEQIFDKLGNEYDVARKEALKNEHEAANIVGGVAGFMTSMLYGGEVTGAEKAAAYTERAILGGEKLLATRLAEAGVQGSERIAPSLARKVAAKAAATGVEGVLLQAPATITEAALGDPEKAAEHVLINFGAGAALGGLGKLGGEAIERGIGKLGMSAEEQATKSLFYSRDLKNQKLVDALPGGTKGLGRRLLDDDLTRGINEDWEQVASKINAKRTETGKAIGGLYSELDGIGSKVKLTSTDELANLFRREVVSELERVPGNEAVVNKVNAYIDSFERTGARGSEYARMPTFDAFKASNLAAYAAEHGGEAQGLEALTAEYRRLLANAKTGRQLSFSELHEWRQGLDDLIWKEGAIGIQDSAKKQLAKVRDLITNELETKGEQVARDAGTTFIDRLADLNLRYRQYTAAERVANQSASVAKQNRSFSPSDYGIGIGAGAASLAAGNPLPILKGVAYSMGHKFIRENGNGIAARVMDRMGLSTKGARLLRFGLERGEGGPTGVLMAEQAMKDGAEQLDRIPSILDSLSIKRIARQAVVSGPARVAADALLAEHTAQVIANKPALERNIDDLASLIRDQGAPEIGKAYAAKQQNAIEYLVNNMPKAPVADPYRMRNAAIPPGQLASFSRRLEIVEDPFKVLDHVQNGTLAQEHVDAINNVYPKLADEMRARIDQHAFSGNMQPVGFRARQSLQMLGVGGAGNKPMVRAQAQYNQIFSTKPAPRIASGKLNMLPGMAMSDVDRVATKGVGRK